MIARGANKTTEPIPSGVCLSVHDLVSPTVSFNANPERVAWADYASRKHEICERFVSVRCALAGADII